MFTHLHEKNILNFINPFELLKKCIYVFYKLFFLVVIVFVFSIAKAQTDLRQHNFEKNLH